MPASIGPLNAANMLLDQAQQGTPFAGQHSRSSSMQSTSTDYEPAPAADKDAKVPEIVRRDMEFFMARLGRTNSNDSTVSAASSVSR